jgi:hypothetical protein
MTWSEAYFRYLRTSKDEDEWAWLAIDPASDPEDAWAKILTLLEGASDAEEIAAVSAGPLEDLLTEHGSAFLRRVEAEMETRPKLRLALAHIATSGLDDEIIHRLRGALREF